MSPSSPAVPTDPATAPAPERPQLIGLFALALLAIVWAWWAWQEGAFFGVVLLPGTIVLCGGLVIMAWIAPWGARLRENRPIALALFALIGLAIWSALSALWSPAPDVAITDAQRIFVYALSFGLGLWSATLLGSRVGLAMAPLAAAGAVAGVATIIGMATGDEPGRYLELDGTLDYPLGYRNANAAFFIVALFPCLGLAADRELDWRARGAALGAATLCIDLAMLSQSRGSIVAVAIALGVYALLSPLRLRALSWLALAALVSLGVVPALTDLYQAANDQGVSTTADELHAAGLAVALTSVVALVAGAIVARHERRLPGLGNHTPDSNKAVAVGLASLVAVAGVAFVIAVGNPVDWFGERADEFRSGEPDLSAQSSRFGFNAGTNRSDLWRVALDEWADDPFVGGGGGGFPYVYTAKRDLAEQTAHDAHSVELELLSELGVVGFALLAAALGGAVIGIAKARRVDARAAALAAIAFTTAVYWLTHSSIDWFWPYPAITAPVFALLGSACAPGLKGTTPESRSRGKGRVVIVAGAVVLALSAVPFFLSERYVNRAYSDWRSNLSRAYADLDAARSLNPFSDDPWLAEGAIADAAGDRARAIAAFREAADVRPEEWAAHFLLAELYAEEAPELARRELEVARELNPLSPEVRSLQRQLDVPSGS